MSVHWKKKKKNFPQTLHITQTLYLKHIALFYLGSCGTVIHWVLMDGF